MTETEHQLAINALNAEIGVLMRRRSEHEREVGRLRDAEIIEAVGGVELAVTPEFDALLQGWQQHYTHDTLRARYINEDGVTVLSGNVIIGTYPLEVVQAMRAAWEKDE